MDGGLLISALVIDRDGTIAGFQDKVQLDPSEEATYTPGAGRRVFQAGPLTFGIAICHEGWRYPETVRCGRAAGAQVVFHPHFHEAEPGGYRPTAFADPANTFHEKAALCRAAENTCFFATVNYASPGSPTTSAVVRPDGTLLASPALRGDGPPHRGRRPRRGHRPAGVPLQALKRPFVYHPPSTVDRRPLTVDFDRQDAPKNLQVLRPRHGRVRHGAAVREPHRRGQARHPGRLHVRLGGPVLPLELHLRGHPHGGVRLRPGPQGRVGGLRRPDLRVVHELGGPRASRRPRAGRTRPAYETVFGAPRGSWPHPCSRTSPASSATRTCSRR